MGETLEFTDCNGKEHVIEIGPTQTNEKGETSVYMTVDHHQRVYLFEPEIPEGAVAGASQLSKEEVAEFAIVGDMRAPFAGNVCDIVVEEGQEVAVGDRLVILEAMKMQTPVNSEVVGKVGKIFVELGKAVNLGDKLLKIKVVE